MQSTRRFIVFACVVTAIFLGCPSNGDDDLGVDERWWEETEGSVSLLHMQMPGFGNSVGFQAAFADIVVPAADDVYPQTPSEPDQCATAQYTLDDVENMDLGEYVDQSAGSIALSGQGLSVDLEPALEDGQLAYRADFEEGEITYGTDYEVSATGEDFPAFSGVLETTEPIEVVSLDGYDTLDGDVSILWEGTDGAHAYVVLAVVTAEFDARGIVCTVENDGSFTIPGALVAELPQGSPSLMLQQFNYRRQEVEGRSLGFTAGSLLMYLSL